MDLAHCVMPQALSGRGRRIHKLVNAKVGNGIGYQRFYS